MQHKACNTPRRTLSCFEQERASPYGCGFGSSAIQKALPLVCLAVPLQMWHSKFA